MSSNLEKKILNYINFSAGNRKDAAFMSKATSDLAKSQHAEADKAKAELDKAKEYEKEHKSPDNKDWNQRLAKNVENKEKAYTDAVHKTVGLTNVASEYQKKADNNFSTEQTNFSQWNRDDLDPTRYYAFKVKEDGTIDKGCQIEDKKGYATEIEALNAIGDKPNCKVVAGSTLLTKYPHLIKE